MRGRCSMFMQYAHCAIIAKNVSACLYINSIKIFKNFLSKFGCCMMEWVDEHIFPIILGLKMN